ncbi:serine hydrolase [Mycobacterium sp. NAZ190054]|uniref:serine hydrolase domain-containing protein n=1 Tax=Mycobacterium sp. NAZ190054 TaxID=1747766 RepID=UPI00079B64FD|nr:serine hydrolase domain-containing protein [Mycobacterium sp. NAZ190054]KWX66587.1 serine hydrolase [Mycobacterium sp. NAZ190054]
MTRVVAAVLAVVLAATGCGESVDATRSADRHGTSVVAPATTMAPQITGRLDSAVERVIDEAGIPGAIIGIWTPDGDYVRAFGVADKKTRAPMKTDLFSRIGSQTKAFTVTAVLLLADQGRLGLDDPVARYVEGVPGGQRITLRQLARMQSGLPDYSADPGFARAVYDDPRRSFTPRELLDYAFSRPPSFAPGDGFEYCNTNTVLLGLVVEKVSGRTMAEFLREHVTGPLGMTGTSFPTDSRFPRPHAAGYTMQTADGRETTATDWNPSWAWAAGNMISTLHDMRIWAPALATGSLLTPQMQQERLQTVDRSGAPAPQGYGLGVFDVAGWIGHNGSLPGYQTVSVHLPEREASLVILVNTDIAFRGADPGTLLATAITGELTPDHVYRID